VKNIAIETIQNGNNSEKARKDGFLTSPAAFGMSRLP
jgi:hypothetical protein